MLLLATVFGPLLLAAACYLTKGRTQARWLALLGGVCVLAVGGVALADFYENPGADFRFVASIGWSEALGVNLRFGLDGMSAAMLALSGLVTTIATISGFGQEQNPRGYHALVLVMLGAVNAVFATLDLLVFYVAWELMLVPMLLLIGLWGGKQRRYAATKFFVYTLAGSVMMLAALLLLWSAIPEAGQRVAVTRDAIAAYSTDAGRTLFGLTVEGGDGAFVTVPRGFDLRHLALAWQTFRDTEFVGVPLSAFGFLSVIVACLVKVPAVPVHTWLPHAHVEAPTAVSVLLAGVLLKLGVYGLYRVAFPLFPSEATAWAPTFGVVGVIGILWGAIVAFGQTDLKRLVAYSSVSHMGFCLLGLGSLTFAGLSAGMVQAVTHGLSSSLLFLLVGVLYDRAHHRQIDGFGGIAGPMPRFTWFLLFGALASAGLPGLAGFPGEFLALSGAFTAGGSFPAFGVLAASSVILSAAYTLSVVRRVSFGPLRREAHGAYADCDRRELFALTPLCVLIVLLGVWPKPLVDALQPAVVALVQHTESATR